jgi:hypothetical protein
MGGPPSHNRSQKLALSHPTIEICCDRGNRHYQKDHPVSQPSSSDLSHPLIYDPLVVKNVRGQLESAQMDVNHEVAKYFIPRGEFAKIMTFHVIRSILYSLQCCNDLSGADKEDLTSEIWYGGGQRCHEPCVRLLAALIGSHMENELIKFIDDGINDKCLPLGFVTGNFLGCQHCSRQHGVLDQYARKERRDFCNFAYAITAPYLKGLHGHHVHYELDQNDRLPIIETYRRGVSSEAPIVQQSGSKTLNTSENTILNNSNGTYNQGGFSIVDRVVFDPSHINFESSEVSKIHE